MYMKKSLLLMMLICSSVGSMAQETIGDEKHRVTTNPFWSNWFVQAHVVGTSFWGSQENQSIKFDKMFKGYRTNLGFSVALGKWFTPGLGLRTKFTGVWGRTVLSEDKSLNASKYWTLQEQAMFNLSNMFLGYNEHRVWNLIPYIGAGFGRNMSYNSNAMGLSIGLLNTFRVSPKVCLNFDINWGGYEARFDGCDVNTNQNGWKNNDRVVNIEFGLTYSLGKSTWKRSQAQDAMDALTQSEIDALNGQVADLQAENDRLSGLLSQQSVPQEKCEKVVERQVVSAPVSVFFNLNQAVIASKRDLQNVADLVTVAKQQGTKLIITGYADSQTGSIERNRQLSQQRADVVADEIVKMGMAREKLEIVAAGGVDTLSPMPYNRRVTVEMR